MRLQLRAKLPAQGPGLVFVTLPAAFLQTPGATWVALAFFIQRLRATLTSALSLLENAAELRARHPIALADA